MTNSFSTKFTILFKELNSIFFIYLKVFLAAVFASAFFFFFYAGIKADRISIELIAAVFAAFVTCIGVLVSSFFVRKKSRDTLHLVLGDIREINAERKSKKSTNNETERLIRLLANPTSILFSVVIMVVAIMAILEIGLISLFKKSKRESEQEHSPARITSLP